MDQGAGSTLSWWLTWKNPWLRQGFGQRDRKGGAKIRQKPLLECFSRPWKIWVDRGYSGPNFADSVPEQRHKLEFELTKHSDELTGFHVLTKRRITECILP